MLHPFKDGNGRIGRMLIPLLLYQRGALSRPMFYMSEYLESHRREYYDRLLYITENRDWHGWVTFFLNAVVIRSEEHTSELQSLMRNSYAVFCLQKKKKKKRYITRSTI